MKAMYDQLNPLDYSLLGWLFASAEKAEKFRLLRGLAEMDELRPFFNTYAKPGCDTLDVPVAVGVMFNDLLLADLAPIYRSWGHPESQILECHPEAHHWVIVQANHHNTLNRRAA